MSLHFQENNVFNIFKQSRTISSINNNDILPLSTTSSWSSVKKFPYEELLKLKPSASDLIQQKTVEKLVQRLLPKHYKWFVLKVNGNYFSENNLDRFKVTNCSHNYYFINNY